MLRVAGVRGGGARRFLLAGEQPKPPTSGLLLHHHVAAREPPGRRRSYGRQTPQHPIFGAPPLAQGAPLAAPQLVPVNFMNVRGKQIPHLLAHKHIPSSLHMLALPRPPRHRTANNRHKRASCYSSMSHLHVEQHALLLRLRCAQTGPKVAPPGPHTVPAPVPADAKPSLLDSLPRACPAAAL